MDTKKKEIRERASGRGWLELAVRDGLKGRESMRALELMDGTRRSCATESTLVVLSASRRRRAAEAASAVDERTVEGGRGKQREGGVKRRTVNRCGPVQS
jgi:hypothetical protein